MFLIVPGLGCCVGFSLVVASRGYSLVAVCRPLIVVASLVVEHGLQLLGMWAPEHKLSCSLAYEIFPTQRLNSCLLHWQTGSLPLSHQGSPGAGLNCMWRWLQNLYMTMRWRCQNLLDTHLDKVITRLRERRMSEGIHYVRLSTHHLTRPRDTEEEHSYQSVSFRGPMGLVGVDTWVPPGN